MGDVVRTPAYTPQRNSLGARDDLADAEMVLVHPPSAPGIRSRADYQARQLTRSVH